MSDLLQQIMDNEFEILDDKVFYRDGGTIGFSIKGQDGQIQQLYLDERMDSTTKGVFYKNAFPGEKDAIELGRNDALAARIKSS
jgi:hypothetical protein